LCYAIDLSVLPAFLEQYKTVVILILIGFLLHAAPIKWNDLIISFASKMHWAIKAIVLTVVLSFLYYFNSAGQVLPIYLQF
jgi:hypothetical protein